MNQISGFCRRICNECEIFKVTQADDDQKRAAMAAAVNKMFDQDFKPENINCNGCTVQNGRLYSFCKECSIRNREIQSQGGWSCPYSNRPIS